MNRLFSRVRLCALAFSVLFVSVASAQDTMFLVTLDKGPNWPAGIETAPQIEGIEGHVAQMQKLHESGVVLVGGPVVDLKSAVLVVRADSQAQAIGYFDEDPFVQAGYFAPSVRQFSASIGSASAASDAVPAGWGVVAPGRYTVTQEYIVGAPSETVWKAFTTTEGVESFMAPLARADFRIGGSIECSYDENGELGDASTITTRILAIEPGRMYVSRVEAPEGFDWADLIEQTWSVVTVDPIAPTITRIKFAECNYGRGGRWDEMAEFFEGGNAWVIDQLRKSLGATDVKDDGERALALLNRLIGGEWIHESTTPDGGVFRSRNIFSAGADGASLTSRGWLGGADGMWDHGSTMIYRDPSDFIAFTNINELGDVVQGAVWSERDDTVVWDWKGRDHEGEAFSYIIEQQFTGDDTYVMRMYEDIARDKAPFEIEFTRVDKAPGAFLQLKTETH